MSAMSVLNSSLSGSTRDAAWNPVRRRTAFGRRKPKEVQMAAPADDDRLLGLKVQDIKEFLMAYCACFMAVMGLIA